MRRISLVCLLLCVGFSLLACARRGGAAAVREETVSGDLPVAVVEDPPAAEAETEIEHWQDQLLAVAAEYRHYTKISDDPDWAPTMCRAPIPMTALKSQATTKKAHGRKLYFLWVKDSDAYSYDALAALTENKPAEMKKQPVGQALVKESYHPADPDGKSRTLGEPSGLFVMLKLDPDTPGTDAGWVYGTVSPDGKKVTAAGLIESCMDCHDEAGEERLFGPPVSDFRVPRTPPEK
ncbi:MAG: cytochrome P460 family protein [Planctomycetes bacterium]|nr:cytochrome P460 family protein [Planctomycetota bacterium]